MSQNTDNVEREYKDEGQILKPSTTEHPLYGKIVEACKTVYDPEIPVNIYDLGLIYRVDCLDNCDVNIEMSLTAPACPVAGELPKEVCEKVSSIDNVGEVAVKLVWDPAWTKDMMSEDAKLLLDIS